MSRPSPPPVGAEALCAAEQTATNANAEYVPTLTAAAALRVSRSE